MKHWLLEKYHHLDRLVTRWMADKGISLLRISVGIVYIWFGALKFFPDLSPAEGLAVRAISALSFDLFPKEVSLPVLAIWECLIGVGLITKFQLRLTILLLFFQMFGTISPVILFPQEIFVHFPYALTLEGQYIVKNLIIISAAIVIGATVRGGKLIADPQVAQAAKKREDQKNRI